MSETPHPIATPSPEPTPPQPRTPMHVPDEENALIEKPDPDGKRPAPVETDGGTPSDGRP